MRVALLVIAGCRFGFDAVPADPPLPPPADGLVRVTVEHTGGQGMVTGPGAFTCSTGTCALDVEPGTAVSLRGLAPKDAWFAGWRGPCGGNFSCDLVVTADVTVTAEFSVTPNRVFVTSIETSAAFGGIAGGDAICATRAAAAGLSGTFLAYLSDSTTDAVSRLASSRGWVRTDGAPFADSPSDFANGGVIFPTRLDELGSDLGDVYVYTGTAQGVKTSELCADWTSSDSAQNGTVNEVKFGFDLAYRSGGIGCGNPAHLLCVETGRVVPVATRPDTGSRAFTTTSYWQPGGGRASADAHCAAEASLAGLTGTFLAAVATTTESIASRFPSTAIYRRSDDVRLLRGAGLWTADFFDVPPQLDQFGDVVAFDIWTGALRLDRVAQPEDNCNDWTATAEPSGGQLLYSTNSDLRSPWKTDPCSVAAPLLCLEN